ncbi:MAG TPA: response regulator [Flavobacteriaceae bacterium]|nr:response regulator [Flavobacteriaceae bacterium]
MEKKGNILIVDDDSGIGEMLKMLLELEGYTVTFLEEPEDTEAQIEEKNIDLVILDMLISGVNGTEVCRRIRKNKNTKETAVLMMSALHDAGQKCKSAGANDFIAKPFEIEDLMEKIDEILTKP